jgi:hypothetical protein
MAKVEFIRHKDKEILFLDFSNGNPEDNLPVLEETKKIIAVQPYNSLLTLVDVTSAKFNNESRDKLKAFALHNKPYVKASAVVGVAGLAKVLYTVVMQFSGRNIPIFNTLEEAKDWLVEQ